MESEAEMMCNKAGSRGLHRETGTSSGSGGSDSPLESAEGLGL